MGTVTGCLPKWASASALFTLSALNGANRVLLHDFVLEDAPVAASGPLGLVHGLVGVREQGGQVPAGQALGDADAGAVGQPLAVAAEGTDGWAGQLIGDLGRAQGRDPHDDDDELIAAVAAH